MPAFFFVSCKNVLLSLTGDPYEVSSAGEPAEAVGEKKACFYSVFFGSGRRGGEVIAKKYY